MGKPQLLYHDTIYEVDKIDFSQYIINLSKWKQTENIRQNGCQLCGKFARNDNNRISLQSNNILK